MDLKEGLLHLCFPIINKLLKFNYNGNKTKETIKKKERNILNHKIET